MNEKVNGLGECNWHAAVRHECFYVYMYACVHLCYVKVPCSPLYSCGQYLFWATCTNNSALYYAGLCNIKTLWSRVGEDTVQSCYLYGARWSCLMSYCSATLLVRSQ